MSAPGTYGELKTSIREYLGVASGSSYAGDADLFIDLAEQRFNMELRTRSQITRATLSPDANGEADLPADFAGFFRAVALEGSRRIELEECSPGWMDDQFPLSAGGIAKYLTIEGGKVRIRPITSADIEFRYYAIIPALSDSQPTNWLLTKAPGLYLAASLYEAAQFYNDDNASRYAQMMGDHMRLLKMTDSSERIMQRRMVVPGPTP